MIIEQTLTFKKEAKKLHHNQKNDLDNAVRALIQDPQIGQLKKGDFAEVRIYKFKMNSVITLLAYIWEPNI